MSFIAFHLTQWGITGSNTLFQSASDIFMWKDFSAMKNSRMSESKYTTWSYHMKLSNNATVQWTNNLHGELLILKYRKIIQVYNKYNGHKVVHLQEGHGSSQGLPCWASMTAGSTLARSSITTPFFSVMTLVCSSRACWISWDVTFFLSASCWSFTWSHTHTS